MEPQESPLVKILKKVKYGIAAAILIGAGISVPYTVPIDSVGVVQRFGKHVRTENPGLHFKIPFGVESVQKVKVQEVGLVEFGFRTSNRGKGNEASKFASGNQFRNEYLMLTGDLNMVDIESSVQYKIADPAAYLFNVKDAESLIRIAHNSLLREEVGNGSIDEALMIKRNEYVVNERVKLQEILDKYHSGIKITAVNLQSTNPPERVRESFNAVNNAIQQREKRINEAKQEYNKEVPKAQGEGQKLIADSEAYQFRRVNESKSAVAEFSQVLDAYLSNRDITEKRMYLEAISNLLPRAKTYVIEQKGIENSLLLKLDLDERENRIKKEGETK